MIAGKAYLFASGLERVVLPPPPVVGLVHSLLAVGRCGELLLLVGSAAAFPDGTLV
jgi:hypothetical protein